MRKLFIFCLVSFLYSCSGEETKKAQQKPEKEKSSLMSKPKGENSVVHKSYNYITEETVVNRLTIYGKENLETIVLLSTSKGNIKIRLFKDTPLHRANFIMMVKEGYFDGTVFTRVVKNFMAQGGGTYDESHSRLKRKIGNYSIPAEFTKKHYHKKGAIGAARGYQNNPEMRSAPYSFYFIEGTKYSNNALDHYEAENNYKYPIKHRNYYCSEQGAAHIDGLHTVFGEIIEGYSVVPKLTAVTTDSRDWPNTDLFIDSVIVIK